MKSSPRANGRAGAPASTPRELIYRSSHDLHCGLWHHGKKGLWPRRNRRSTACWHSRVRVMPAATDRFVAWCKQEQASIEQELELITSGKVRIGRDMGSGWIDKNEEAIERAKRRLSQLNELLTEEGKTTVIKPDAL